MWRLSLPETELSLGLFEFCPAWNNFSPSMVLRCSVIFCKKFSGVAVIVVVVVVVVTVGTTPTRDTHTHMSGQERPDSSDD